jgi:microcystin-dependent protein
MTIKYISPNRMRLSGRSGYSMKYITIVLSLFLLIVSGQFSPMAAQDAYIGELMLVPYNFAPRGYVECNGQLLSIASNTALFSILGTTYGGDGRTTFGIPNLNDRTPLHVGQGPGLSNYSLGQSGGAPTHTLTVNEMPQHSHSIAVSSDVGTSDDPSGKYHAASGTNAPMYASPPNTTFASTTLGSTGGGQAHNNWQPYLGLKWVICIQGIFPSRN